MSVVEPLNRQSEEAPSFRDLLDALPAAVYTTDADGTVTFYNNAAEELAGRKPEIGRDKWCVSWQLRWPDGESLPLDECPMAMCLKQGKTIRNIDVVAVRPNGQTVPVMPFPTPLFDARGNVIGAINMLVDISELQHTREYAARRADEQAALYRFTDRLYRANAIDDVYEAALDAIIAALACSRASILLFDDRGVMQFVGSRGLSQSYRDAVAGHTPWKTNETAPQPILVESIEAADELESLQDVVRREGITALAFIPIVVNGALIGKFMAYHDKPHAFSGEEVDLGLTIARQLGFAIERERGREYRRRAAQADELRELLASIVEGSEDAIISKNLSGTIMSWNKGAERLFGYKPDEIIGRSVLTLIPPEHHDEEPSIIARISRGERIEHYETVRRRKDGSSVHISLTVSPVRDATGAIVGASKVARDISDRKRADQQRALLINELNHRVKNTLATVQSLALQTMRNTERSDEARDLFDSRLSALSRAHDLLTAQNWEGASLADVVNRAVSPFRTDADRFTVTGPHVHLTPKQALALSIALHELATNAAKYGGLSNDAGRVSVEWSVTPNDNAGELHLTWAETGGPPVERPKRSGFGSRLIERSLANELGGAAIIEYRPDGVVATVSSPLEAPGADGRLSAW